MSAPAYQVVVLAGGRSRRFGSDKLVLLLDTTLSGLPPGVPVVCVGPVRPTPSRPDAVWAREEPPGGGPLSAVAAALRSGTGARPPVVVLAGGDMPAVGAAVPALVAALDEAGPAVDAVLLSDAGGRGQVLASAWHRAALEAAVGGLDAFGGTDGIPLQRVLDGVQVLLLPDRWAAVRDVDTPADLTAPGTDLPKPTVE